MPRSPRGPVVTVFYNLACQSGDRLWPTADHIPQFYTCTTVLSLYYYRNLHPCTSPVPIKHMYYFCTRVPLYYTCINVFLYYYCTLESLSSTDYSRTSGPLCYSWNHIKLLHSYAPALLLYPSTTPAHCSTLIPLYTCTTPVKLYYYYTPVPLYYSCTTEPLFSSWTPEFQQYSCKLVYPLYTCNTITTTPQYISWTPVLLLFPISTPVLLYTCTTHVPIVPYSRVTYLKPCNPVLHLYTCNSVILLYTCTTVLL